jgi:YVTN family beta-propeller protein
MKKYPLSFAVACAAIACSHAADAPVLGKAADNKIYAQQLVNQLMATNPDLVVVGLHATVPGSKQQTMIATNLDRVGKKDDDDDIAVAVEHKTILAPNLTDHRKFEVQVPLKDSAGHFLGAAAGLVFKYTEGADEVAFHVRALEIRQYLAQNTPDLAALLAPGGALVPSVSITIPDSKGKFDFLTIDPERNRLLAAHEKDGTADILDLTTRKVLARLKVGPAVGTAIDTKTGKYFVSVQDDKRIAVIDPSSLSETNSITMEGETDAIIFDPKDRHVFVTNDNGKFLWVIDADSEKVIASIPIPSAPECMAYDAKTDRVYLNLKSANQVAVIDTKTNSITTLWDTGPAKNVHGIAFDEETGRLFTAGDNKMLAVIDTASGKVVGSAPIVEGVDQIAFDPSSKHIYCTGAGQMTVLAETGDGVSAVGDVTTAANAKNVAVDPKTHAVWSTYTDGTNSYAKSWILP